jgi:hypothetical protein
MVFLGAIIPLRHVVFNESAVALAVLLIGVMIAAVLGGVFVAGKAGWCTTFCPMLPIERLYGQQPVATLPHAHCTVCSGCVSSCIDLLPGQSMPVQKSRGKASYTTSALEYFAISFPGFVVGYFMAADGMSIIAVYSHVIVWSLVSAVVITIIRRLLKLRRQVLFKLCAAAASGFYYWLAIPAIADATSHTFHLKMRHGWSVESVRIIMVVLIAGWLYRALRESAIA